MQPPRRAPRRSAAPEMCSRPIRFELRDRPRRPDWWISDLMSSETRGRPRSATPLLRFFFFKETGCYDCPGGLQTTLFSPLHLWPRESKGSLFICFLGGECPRLSPYPSSKPLPILTSSSLLLKPLQVKASFSNTVKSLVDSFKRDFQKVKVLLRLCFPGFLSGEGGTHLNFSSLPLWTHTHTPKGLARPFPPPPFSLPSITL